MLASARFFGLAELVKMLIPSSMLRKRKQHAATTKTMINRRMTRGDDAQRSDFMAYVLKHNDEKGMSVPEIENTMKTLVIAGSETTGTTLSGIMNNLLQHRDIYETLANEVRTSFASESEIRADRVPNLKYLNAVIEEGLRLCTPVPMGMPRVVPEGGAEVSGKWLPGGVRLPRLYLTNTTTIRLLFQFPNSILPFLDFQYVVFSCKLLPVTSISALILYMDDLRC